MTFEGSKNVAEGVGEIYKRIDSVISKHNPQCSKCGNCCDFESFGHKLYVSTPEMIYFKSHFKGPYRKMTRQICPYLENGKCTVHNRRFAGCRIFFCRADAKWQNELSEQIIKELKLLCEQNNISWQYAELSAALDSDIAGMDFNGHELF